MKIGLVLERFDPQKGGLENWTWQFARRLQAGGDEVHVVAFESAAIPPDAGFAVHTTARPESPLQRAAALEERVRPLGLDVIHDMGCGWHADLFHPHGGSTTALWEHNLMRIPRWRRIRFWREQRYREMAELERRQHARTGSLVVAVSRMVLDHFRRLHNVPEERLRLVYNGVDTEHFSPGHRAALREPFRSRLGCGNNETLFLLVAHNLLLKNAETALRALARLAAAGAPARLAIVGGKKTERFARLARRLGVETRVAFAGPVADVRPWYAAADVHLHPTWYDPCSLVALEAFASGLPVITTQFNGASELMTSGVHGFIAGHPADVPGIAANMEALLDPAARDRMGAAARALALRHTLDNQAAQFIGLYREIISTSHKSL